MYVPAHFSESNPEVLKEFIKTYPFGLLVTNGKSGLDANHIPFEVLEAEGLGKLTAHVARANPVWQDVQNGDEVLVVFKAADSYISPTWYPSKQEHHKQVPTWNYMVTHVHGRISIHDDERYVRGVVARLTRTHEASMQKPWKMSDGPADFIDGLLKAIVGIEIDITSMVGKIKLSQNKDVRDVRNVGEVLTARGSDILGAATLRAADEKEKSQS
ncbi:FMN-binding negative transcriptional regulator [Herbaspirillum lusitanum]|jgi:transcriptional regulator|uniref:FMN-binding negative transcriptional regulator n=1 Tax=Herbaspirillum lusitanum TaxID=213312 RepID=A0ABW9A8X0_9BURK